MSVILFRIEKQVQFGQGIYLATSQNGWEISENSRMKCIDKTCWEQSIEITSNEFEYKYVIADYDKPNSNNIFWENGPNRQLNERKTNQVVKEDRWDKRFINIVLSQEIKQSLAIVFGNIQELKDPKIMKFNKNSKCFKLTVPINFEEVKHQIQLQYYLLAKQKEFISSPIYIENSIKIPQKIHFFSL